MQQIPALVEPTIPWRLWRRGLRCHHSVMPAVLFRQWNDRLDVAFSQPHRPGGAQS